MERLDNYKNQINEGHSKYQAPKQVEKQDLLFFHSFIPEDRIITDSKELEVYNIDTQRIFKGNSKLLIFPVSTQEVSKIMAYCTQNYLQVVIQGGHSSLVGGGTPAKEEIILNFSKFNKIIQIDEQSRVLICQPGCILSKVQQQLNKKNLQLPYDIMSRERCMIGGNVATHAGGVMYCKYGPMRAYVLGLEVVLPDGRILNMESEVRKDNTLQDLKQLFIGSEGTLGIITRIQIALVPLEKYKSAIFVKVGKFDDVIKCLEISQKILGSDMSAFESFDYASYSTSHKLLGKAIKFPFKLGDSELHKFYNLIEISSKKPLDGLKQELEQELLKNNAIEEFQWGNSNDANFRNNWMIRKMIANAFISQGIMLAFDVSLNILEFDKFVKKVEKWTGKLVGGFGHMGDGNLHLAILCKDEQDLEEVNKKLDPVFYEYLQSINGSISAEHGIGRQKAEKMKYAKTQIELEFIAKIKKQFDPQNLLNPYAFESQNFSKYNVLKYSCF